MPSCQMDGIPHLYSYVEALAYYNKTKPWPDELSPIGRRALSRTKRHKRHMNIRRRHIGPHVVGEIACELYDTDVVIYREDGAIEIRDFFSVSTNNFVNVLLGPNVVANFTNLEQPLIWLRRWIDKSPYIVDEVGWRMPNCGPLILYADANEPSGWRISLTTPPPPFERSYVDRRRAQHALHKRGYYDFKTWLTTVLKLEGERENQESAYVPRNALVNLLADRSTWHVNFVRNEHTFMGEKYDTLLVEMRKAIYAEDQCIVTERKAYITSYAEMLKMRRTWE